MLALLARRELVGLLQRAPQQEDQRHDEAADQEGNAPAPLHHRVRRHDLAEQHAQQRHEDDGDLLAAGLPADIEALVALGRDLREIDRDAAELDAGGEALDEAPGDDDDGREQAEQGVAGDERDRQGADGHEAERQQPAGAAAVATTRACGSAMPTSSEAKRIRRRTI